MYAWPFFFAAGVLELGIFDFNESEVAEMLIGSGLLVVALSYLANAGDDTRASLPGDQPSSAWLFVTPIVLAIVFSLAMTGITLATPTSRTAAKDRVHYALQSYGSRYANYTAWENSIALYRRYLDAGPYDVQVLGELARVFHDWGCHKKSRDTLRQLLRFNSIHLKKYPDHVLA